uniref:Uncharacterized protein n=1 Tax=Oryza glumipatula TaxID=40148 RepID=A0A0D9Z239_9ORYZ
MASGESDVIASCPATAGQGALVWPAIPTSLGFPAAKLAGYDGNGWVPALAEHISTSESKAIEHARRCKEATIACGLQRFQGLLVPFLPSGPRLSGTHLFATLLGHKQAKEIN